MDDTEKHEGFIDSYNSRMLLVCFFYCFLPTIALFILGDWFQLIKGNKIFLSKPLSKLLIASLLLLSWINVYYFSAYTFRSLQGKMHMISASFIFLFTAYLLCTQIKDHNIKIGIIISYIGISVSFITLVTEYYFQKLEKMTYLFLTGMTVYIFGYILICARLTAIWVCNKATTTTYKAK